MPRAKITNKRIDGINRGIKQSILAQRANYEVILTIADADYLRRRAMEFLVQGDTNKAMEMLILDKVLA